MVNNILRYSPSGQLKTYNFVKQSTGEAGILIADDFFGEILAVPSIQSSNVLFAPSARMSAALPLITNTSVLYAPQVLPQPVLLQAPLIVSSSNLFSPAVTTGAVSLSLSFIDNTGQLFVPVIYPGSVDILLPFINETNNLFAPIIPIANPELHLPLLINVGYLFNHRVARKSVAGNPFSEIYIANGTEGLVLDIPGIKSKKILMAYRENGPLFPAIENPSVSEFTWDNNLLRLGTPAVEGQRYLIMYRNY